MLPCPPPVTDRRDLEPRETQLRDLDDMRSCNATLYGAEDDVFAVEEDADEEEHEGGGLVEKDANDEKGHTAEV